MINISTISFFSAFANAGSIVIVAHIHFDIDTLQNTHGFTGAERLLNPIAHQTLDLPTAVSNSAANKPYKARTGILTNQTTKW